ncbi:MAG: T9SS type A sorting domain-containing protein [Chitinophagaceae bacterium]
MKKFFTLLKEKWLFGSALFFILPFTALAQPDYDFRNGILYSGTDLQIGAIYRFNNVKSGVDAFVTITYISPGITIADLDAGSVYPEALQPTLIADPGANGYLEMKFEFLFAGTNTPFIQTRVPVTPIDVDGYNNFDGLGNGVYEFDEIDLGGGYMNYDLLGTELIVTQSGSLFRGYNTAGIDYPGRDTSARQVMFTVVNANISSCIIRVGVDNQTTVSATRLRSVYFKEFWYANGLLPSNGLLSFNGVQKVNGNELNWELSADGDFTGVSIEKSNDGKKFSAIDFKTVSISAQKIKQTYIDATQAEGIVYYRLKLLNANGKYTYSEILIMKSKSNAIQGFKVYPNLVESGAIINLSATKNENAELMIVDLGGRIISRQATRLSQGNNSFQLNNTDRLIAGNYLVVVSVGNEKMTQKIIKR